MLSVYSFLLSSAWNGLCRFVPRLFLQMSSNPIARENINDPRVNPYSVLKLIFATLVIVSLIVLSIFSFVSLGLMISTKLGTGAAETKRFANYLSLLILASPVGLLGLFFGMYFLFVRYFVFVFLRRIAILMAKAGAIFLCFCLIFSACLLSMSLSWGESYSYGGIVDSTLVKESIEWAIDKKFSPFFQLDEDDSMFVEAEKGQWDDVGKSSFFLLHLIAAIGSVGIVVLVVNRKLVSHVGDVAVYVSQHDIHRYADAKRAIEDKVYSLLEDLYQSRHGNNRPRYRKITIIGHSLGSVIAYECINRLYSSVKARRADGKASSVGKDGVIDEDIGKRLNLITLGSPLAKIYTVFYLGSHKSEARRQLSELRYPAFTNNNARPSKWVNVWTPWDIVSSPLSLYYDLDRDLDGENDRSIIELKATELDWPLVSHMRYFDSNLFQCILRRLLGMRAQSDGRELDDAIDHYKRHQKDPWKNLFPENWGK